MKSSTGRTTPLAETSVVTLPELGQLAQIRGRRFVATNIRASHSPLSSPKHLVSLLGMEDDSFGEELQVIWELEPGAVVYEKLELPQPQGFDSSERLEAFLDAVLWGAASSADVRNIQSPFRSGVDIEDYQLDPVVRAIQMPRVNLLVADDVGLGKTIEAGLTAQELILRQRVRRVLIVCPSSLQVQWYEQMRDKFGLDFRIVNRDLMRQLRRRRGLHINPWTHFPRLITSIDFLKRDRALNLFREVLPAQGESIYPRRFDLLIVDEAHNIAPSGGGKYAIDSQRTRAIRFLAPHFEHKLFLTATPHNGYPESFTALLELLDSQRFARGVAPDKKQLQVVMIRRLKSELPPKWDGTPRFPVRHLEAIPVDYTAQEQAMNRLLKEYGTLRRKGSQNQVELYATEFVLKLLKKRLFSSPAAFLTTLEQHERSLQEPKQTPSRPLTNGQPQAPEFNSGVRLTPPTVGILQRQWEANEEDFVDDEDYEEFTESAIASTSSLFRELTAQEQQYLDEMKALAEQASQRPDTKATELLNWINTHIRPDGNWSKQRVIIFTEYRTTQKWLYDLLASQGLASEERLLTLYGGMNSEEREKVKAAFQASPEISQVRILLATDAASEGLDLQNHCFSLIHYEIPWNPNRMEQRNGRIDRHGQKSSQVWVYHFVGKDYQTQSAASAGDLDGDLEFLMRAALKVNNIREDLGKVGPVIAAQVEEAMLGKRHQLDTSIAERDSEPVRRMLKFERQIRVQIEKLREQLQETRKSLHLTPDNIESVVKIGLDLAEQPPLIAVEGEKEVYRLPALKGSWASCSEGLAHPHSGEIRPISFNPDVVKGRDDVVLVHLNHRLVQMCLRLLRAEVWSNAKTSTRLHRVCAEIVPSSELESPAVIAYGRLLILGGDSQRLHEEVITAGGILKAGRFSRLNVMKIRQALQSVTGESVPEAMQQRLLALWETYQQPLLRSLEVRMEERTKGLEKALQERCEKEMSDVTTILQELADSIRQELASVNQPQQLELFNNAEREQFDHNRTSLEVRLEQIPTEIAQETQVIRDRFANPKPRLFPLALKFLVPKKLTNG